MPITGSQQAPLYALVKVMRVGATRVGYVSNAVYFMFDGVPLMPPGGQPHVGVLLDSLSITDAIDETVNTCTFKTNAFVPAAGSEVRVTMGSRNRITPFFAGFALTVTQSYAGKPANVQADVSAVDYTWLLGFLKVTEQYRYQSATFIAGDLVARWGSANGFTAHHVAPNLPYLDDITFTDEDLPNALTRLARRVGGYWYVDYQKDVHLFYEESDNPPLALTPSHPSLANVSHERSRTQVLTRVYVEGRGSSLLSDVNLGETKIPLMAVDAFQPAPDVFAKASFQGAEGGAQHFQFTGVVEGGGGAIVGPGVTPSAGPTAVVESGGSIEAGTHYYAYTWVTASGETKPSPATSVQLEARTVANPTDALQGIPSSSPGLLVPGGSYRFKYGYSRDAAWPPQFVTLASPASNPIIASAQGNILGAIKYSPDTAVTQVNVYRTTAGGSTFYLYARWENFPSAGGGVSSIPLGANSDANLVAFGVVEPSANTTTFTTGRVALSDIAVGPGAVTTRKLYRTAANHPQLRLLTTLANNTVKTYTDSASDTTLGANAPTSDTAALPQPSGQVASGDSTIVVTTTAPFDVTGGWAIIGNGEQGIRYTGISGNTLTGIPPSGAGAVTATISYGSNITAAAMLTGIPSSGPWGITTRGLTKGDEVYVVVQRDDVPRQAQLADQVNIGPGLREEWVQDRRLSIPEARARGDATLQIRPLEDRRLSYTCRDTRTASGKTITVNLPAPTNLSGTFRIQQVTIANFRPQPAQPPTFTVDASAQRFSFEDWLRRIKTRE